MRLLVPILSSLTLMGAPVARATPDEQPVPRVTPALEVVQTYQGHTAEWWARTARRSRRAALKLRSALRQRLPLTGGLTSAFLCIHRFEGSWTDPGGPYFGGLQMDYQFAATYGPVFLHAWGTPDRWPPFVQVAVAQAAYLSGRGFAPWPNTARACGLR